MTRWARANLGRKCPLEASSWDELKKNISSSKTKAKSLQKNKRANTSEVKELHNADDNTDETNRDRKKRKNKNIEKVKANKDFSFAEISTDKSEAVAATVETPVTKKEQNFANPVNNFKNSSIQSKGSSKKAKIKFDRNRKQNFKCRPENSERLLELKEILSKAKVSKKEEWKILRKEQDKIRRKERRAIKGRCFKCRKIGHRLEDCPSADKKEGAGICFKCGSTEHKLSQCKLFQKEPNANLPFAKCFICEMDGHLASKCPENTNGIYPSGGSCYTCGSVNHFQKDCPKFTNKEENSTVAVAYRQDEAASVDAEIIPETKKSVSTKGPRVILFK